jgi:uroporphyrinogen decarboxylase
VSRTANCLAKMDRMSKTLRHVEADRVPVSDFFWSGFLKRWREELGLSADADIYRYYDLDWIATTPNMDPHIKPFEIIDENDEHVILRTGFEAMIRKKHADPMPAFLGFETDTIDKMSSFVFDDPWDDRRFFQGGDNQIAGVGDVLLRDLPPWIETVKGLHPDFPVYGSVCEGHEMLWRIIGSPNVMLWIGLYPDEVARFVERIHTFNVALVQAQIQAAGEFLDGMVIWGDVAYRNDMFFSPDYWRRVFKPGVKALVDACHAHGLPVIYHGCGNVRRIFSDYVEIGVDAYNPLEAKAGLDVVELRRKYGHDIAFCGNMDVLDWAHADLDELDGIVLRKLNAAKGGGLIFQSDHSVPSNISAARYEYVLNLVRERGTYPLQLGSYDLPDLV